MKKKKGRQKKNGSSDIDCIELKEENKGLDKEIVFNEKKIEIGFLDFFASESTLLFNAGYKVKSFSSLFDKDTSDFYTVFFVGCKGKNYIGLLKINITDPLKSSVFNCFLTPKEAKSLLLVKTKPTTIAFIDEEDNFVFGQLPETKNKAESFNPFFTIKANEDKFSCFKLLPLSSNYYKLFIGGHSGSLLTYIISDSSYTITNKTNTNTNFYITSIDAFSFESDPSPLTPFFVCVACLDGYIKIFKDSSTEPLFEFIGTKKPITDVVWDNNPTLLFFLDENDPKALNVLSFNKNGNITDYVKKMFRSSVELRKFKMNKDKDFFVISCKDGSVNVGKVNVV